MAVDKAPKIAAQVVPPKPSLAAEATAAVDAFEKRYETTGEYKSAWGGRISPVEAGELIEAAGKAVDALRRAKTPGTEATIANMLIRLQLHLPTESSQRELSTFESAVSAVGSGVGRHLWAKDTDAQGAEVPAQTQNQKNLIAFEALEARIKQK